MHDVLPAIFEDVICQSDRDWHHRSSLAIAIAIVVAIMITATVVAPIVRRVTVVVVVVVAITRVAFVVWNHTTAQG